MLTSPALYGVGADYQEDEWLIQKWADIAHSAAAPNDVGPLALPRVRAVERVPPATGMFRFVLVEVVTHRFLLFS